MVKMQTVNELSYVAGCGLCRLGIEHQVLIGDHVHWSAGKQGRGEMTPHDRAQQICGPIKQYLPEDVFEMFVGDVADGLYYAKTNGNASLRDILAWWDRLPMGLRFPNHDQILTAIRAARADIRKAEGK